MEAWRVTAADRDRQQRYPEYLQAFEEMLELIDSEYAAWTIVEATTKRLGDKAPLANASTNNLSKDGQSARQWIFWKGMARMLETVDLTRKMDRECYVREVSRRQIQLRGLGYQVYLQKRPVIIAFEIWDAAGKGGAIKRVIATNGELTKKPWRKCW